ncbi:MAG: hypothetical protein PF795_14275 [Kiritimatiellae bacterium]|nr:hypothetical protein [Kiritimatiellia bacterium]
MASPEALTVLKAKAWLDLTRRKEEGDDKIKSDDIKKHRNDIFRLSLIFQPLDRLALPPELAKDLDTFLDVFHAEHPEWKDIQNAIRPSSPLRLSPAQLLGSVKTQFHLNPSEP